MRMELEVGTVVCVQDREMKEPWCVVSSERTVRTRTLIRYYGKQLGNRDELSRHQGHAFRDGAVVDAHLASTATVTGCCCSVRWRLHC